MTLCTALLAALVLAGCGGNDEEPHPGMVGREDGWEITITLLDGTSETRRVFPSVSGADYDGDGQDDMQELMQGTDPNDPDTAGNLLLDGGNVVLRAGSARALDWIDRGIARIERDDGRLEFQGAHAWDVDPTKQDTAGSGILDGEEVGGFTVWVLGESRFVQTDPRTRDSSGDGLTDGFKRMVGLDPTVRDTLGNGVDDNVAVNPWVDFHVRLEVASLTLTNDPHGRSQRVMWSVFDVPRDRFNGDPVEVQVGQPTDGAFFSSGARDPSDAGGSIRSGQHNVSFTVTFRSDDVGLDLFSATTGTTSLFGTIHALTGEIFWNGGGGGASVPWPHSATFEGEHGDVTLRVLPVWPEAWQRCIDEGCRHGDGMFPWR